MMAVLRSNRGECVRIVLSYRRYRQAMAYLTDAEAMSLAIRFSRGVPLTWGSGQSGIDVEVEVIMDEISLYFRLVDALAMAQRNRVHLSGNGDFDADRLSRGE